MREHSKRQHAFVFQLGSRAVPMSAALDEVSEVRGSRRDELQGQGEYLLRDCCQYQLACRVSVEGGKSSSHPSTQACKYRPRAGGYASMKDRRKAIE